MSLEIVEREVLEELLTEVLEKVVTQEMPEFLEKANQNQWLGTEQVEHEYNISKPSQQRLIDTRQIKFSQNRRKIWHKRKHVEGFLQEHVVETTI